MRFGIHKQNITPKTNLTLDGFIARSGVSTGTLHPLYCTSFVIASNQDKVAIACVDVLGIDINLLQRVQKLVVEQTDIKENAIILNASHTHAAPEAARFGDMGSFFCKNNPTEDDLAYYDSLARNIASSIIEANQSLVDGSIHFHQCVIEGVSSNRVNPSAAFNQTASLFTFMNHHQQPLGLLTMFANHPTVLGSENTQYSNDFISYYHLAIQSEFPGIVSGFAQGCAGEISSRYTKKESSVHETKRLGELLAEQVLIKLKEPGIVLSDSLSYKTLPLHLTMRTFAKKDNYAKNIQKASEHVQHIQETTQDPKALRSAVVALEGQKMMFRMSQELDITNITISMSRVSIGQVSILTTPGETFYAIEKEIMGLNENPTIVLGYTNGYVGYLPDEASYKNADVYEVNMAPTDHTTHKKILSLSQELMG